MEFEHEHSAELLSRRYEATIPVDTVVCLDGMEVVGTYLAEAVKLCSGLTLGGFINHQRLRWAAIVANVSPNCVKISANISNASSSN